MTDLSVPTVKGSDFAQLTKLKIFADKHFQFAWQKDSF